MAIIATALAISGGDADELLVVGLLLNMPMQSILKQLVLTIFEALKAASVRLVHLGSMLARHFLIDKRLICRYIWHLNMVLRSPLICIICP